MNLIMLPMWLLSGIFFSPDRFPAILQPLVQALPLTQLNYALRAVILEGASAASQSWRLAILAVWACGLVHLRASLVSVELTDCGLQIARLRIANLENGSAKSVNLPIKSR